MDNEEEERDGDETASKREDEELAYYYTEPGKGTLGPCTVAQLRVLWVSGHISGTTVLWREGMAAWTAVAQVADVYSELASLTQPPTVDTAGLWYYLDAGSERRGGVTAAQMGVLLRRGDVDGLTSVWREGMREWAELGSIAELRPQMQADDDDEEERLEAMEKMAAQVAYDPDAEIFSAGSSVAPALPPRAAGGGAGVAAGSEPAAAVADGTTDGKPKRVRKNKSKSSFVKKGGTNAYVSGLPVDTDVEEVAECFKMAGVLKTDPESGAPRIKLYTDANGTLKGDGLVSFLKAESVALAVTLRDGFKFRPGHTLRVQAATFEKREGGEGDGGASSGAGGGKRRLGKEELQLRKKQRLLEQKALSEWDAGLSGTGKRNTTVVLTGLFDAAAVAAADAEADGGDAFYANLKQDIEVECRKAGHVERVTVFEASERGAVAVRFKIADDAERCAAMMNERTFGQSTVYCEVYDGVTDYRALRIRNAPRAPPQATAADDLEPESSGGGGFGAGRDADEGEEEKNLDAFGDWLEADSTDEELGDAEDD